MSEADVSLVIYGQVDPHEEVRIVGNRTGLKMLLAVIESALNHPKNADKLPCAFPPDGEGYEIHVEVCDDREKFQSLSSQYLPPSVE